MDALKALAGQQGCSVDGTAASRNPLAQFTGQAMGGPGAMRGGPLQQQGGPQQQGPVSDMDGAFSAGMQGMQGPRGPMMGGPMAQQQHMAAAYAMEFEQMKRAGGPQGPVMAGPRGPMMRPPGDGWVGDFERMQLGHGGGMMNANQVHMEAAYRQSFRPGPGPQAMGQRWAGQMAARPPPSQMDRAWQRSAPVAPVAQGWAAELAGPKEAPNAEQWAAEASAKQAEVRFPVAGWSGCVWRASVAGVANVRVRGCCWVSRQGSSANLLCVRACRAPARVLLATAACAATRACRCCSCRTTGRARDRGPSGRRGDAPCNGRPRARDGREPKVSQLGVL
jgi:hypothetical protein